jgi:hypothetical protein
MSIKLARVLTLGFVIGGLLFAILAAPKAEQPLPEVKEKIVEKPEGKEAKPTPQPKPKPKPQPSNPGDLSCTKTNAQKYVNQKAKEIGLQWQIAYGVVRQESNWDCTPGTDGAGSYGLWQINLPAHPNISWECAHDLVCSTNWAAPHLNYLIDTYGLRNGLAAYNAGAGGMRAGKGFVYADEVIHRINNNLF